MTNFTARVSTNDNFSSNPHLLIVEDPQFKRKIFLQEPAYSLGRDLSNSIVLSSPKVSRHHATLLRRSEPKNNDYSFWIIDGNLQGARSTNGIYVNNKKCFVHELKDGDVINIGDVIITYLYSQSCHLSDLDEPKTAELIDKKLTLNIPKPNFKPNLVISEPNVIEAVEDEKLNKSHKKPKDWSILCGTFLQQISQGVFLVDVTTRKIIEANKAYCQMLDYSLEEILELTLDRILTNDPNAIEKNIPTLLKEKKALVGTSFHRRKDGSLIKLEVNITLVNYQQKELLSFAVTEISSKDKSETFYDSVTGLPTEKIFQEHLAIALANAKRYQYIMTLMLFAIDELEEIETSFGNQVTEQLLKEFAERIKLSLRAGDVAARWEDDTFIILLPRISNISDISKVSQRIINTIKRPFHFGQQQIDINLSVGISVYPQDGQDAQILLENVDIAWQRSKKQGKNAFQFYTSTMNSEASRLSRLENLLRQALEKEQFVLYYQPRVNIKTGKVTGLEALLRWHHPEFGLIAPKKFIPLAEEIGLIVPIGEWVLHHACSQNTFWQQMGLPPVPVTVNLSFRQFQQADFTLMVKRVVNQAGLNPHLLELEITEKIITQNVELASKIVYDLRETGINISMDDFGLGASSIGYLKQFPFHALKINQSFIRNLCDRTSDSAIVSAAITLGRGFNMKVVAKGVETQQQLELLHRFQCEQIQGYLFSHPLTQEDATKFVSCANYSFVTMGFKSNGNPSIDRITLV